MLPYKRKTFVVIMFLPKSEKVFHCLNYFFRLDEILDGPYHQFLIIFFKRMNNWEMGMRSYWVLQYLKSSANRIRQLKTHHMLIS
jgi:hypothetical protein